MTLDYPHTDSEETAKRGAYQRHCRSEAAGHLRQLHDAQLAGVSERDHAKAVDIARTTMRSWDQRRRERKARGIPAFFETKEGVEWVSRLVWALTFVMSLRCPAGLRCICEVLELSGLDAVVASSFGTLQGMAVALHETVDTVGGELQQDLANRRAERGDPGRITVCQDETFHPGILLVATEPASNFILVEEYAERRDAKTWTEVMAKGLSGLPFKVVQSTSDEAVALIKHAKEGLSAHHSADIFHVQHELVKATSLTLRTRQRAADQRVVKAIATVAKVSQKLLDAPQAKRGRGRPKNYARRLHEAEEAEREARAVAQQCAADREIVSEAIRRISRAYHPYDLTTGAKHIVVEVERLVAESFEKIDKVAEQIGLSAKLCKRIDKAERVVETMLETITWTHVEMRVRLADVELTASERSAVETSLIPGHYIRLAAGKASTAEKRDDLREVAERLIADFAATASGWPGFNEERATALSKVATNCAEAFQRSSSCVEGRNGHLALFHHGIHQLRPAKLRSLTVTHNFHVTRPDGSTPAERLFGSTHEPLFEAVLRRLPMCRRPAKKRSTRGRRGGVKNAA